MVVPYAAATSTRSQDEVKKILRRFGCEEVGISDNFERQEVLLYFKHRGREIRRVVSYKGWAAIYLQEHPWTLRHRRSRSDYERDAVKQGYIAINSALRDTIKGEITSIECGIRSFDAVFMADMLIDGRPVIERLKDLLPPPPDQKVIQIQR